MSKFPALLGRNHPGLYYSIIIGRNHPILYYNDGWKPPNPGIYRL